MRPEMRILGCVFIILCAFPLGIKAQDSVLAERPIHFQGLIDAGMGVYIPDPFLKTPELDMSPYLDLVLGTRIKERAFIGAGIGFSNKIYRYYYQHYYENIVAPEEREWHWLPVFTWSLRGDVYVTSGTNIRPFVSTSVGGQLYRSDWYEWYLKTGVGIDYRQFNLGIGLRINDLARAVDHVIYLEFGYRFNAAKYNKQHRATE